MVILAFVFDFPNLIRSWMTLLGWSLPQQELVVDPPEVITVSLWGETPRAAAPAPISEPRGALETPTDPAPEGAAEQAPLPSDVIPLGEKAEEEPAARVKKRPSSPPKVKAPELASEPPPAPRPKSAPNPKSRNVYDMMRRTLGRDARAVNLGSPRGQRRDLSMSQYYNRIAVMICNNWVPAGGNLKDNMIVTYGFTIAPNGKMSGLRKVQSSGDPEFDRSVARAIQTTSFPPLPASFGGRSDSPQFSFSPEALRRRR